MARSIQKGSVLVVSLLLLLIITIVGIAGISNSMLGERVAGNQRQISLALMAAESGLVNATRWLDENPILWGRAADSMTLINTSKPNSAVTWNIDVLEYDSGSSNTALVVSCGLNQDSGVKRCVSSQYIQGRMASSLGAMNIIGETINYSAPTSGAFQMINVGDGPSLAYNADSSSNLLQIIQKTNGVTDKKIEDQYGNKIRAVDFGDPFGDAEKLDAFIKSVKSDYCGCSTRKSSLSFCADTATTSFHTTQHCNLTGLAPSDLGTQTSVKGNKITPAVNKLTYHEGNLTFTGSVSGAGILVVKGNLTFSGTPSFEGLILVTGGSFNVNGGGNGGDPSGSLIVTNLIEVDGKAEFGEVTVDIGGGGTSKYFYNEAKLLEVRAGLLSENTRNQWEISSNEIQQGNSTSRVVNWTEVY